MLWFFATVLLNFVRIQRCCRIYIPCGSELRGRALRYVGRKVLILETLRSTVSEPCAKLSRDRILAAEISVYAILWDTEEAHNTYLYSFPWPGGLLGNRSRRSTSRRRTIERNRPSRKHRNSEIRFLNDKFIIRYVKEIIVALQKLEDVLQLG